MGEKDKHQRHYKLDSVRGIGWELDGNGEWVIRERIK